MTNEEKCQQCISMSDNGDFDCSHRPVFEENCLSDDTAAELAYLMSMEQDSLIF